MISEYFIVKIEITCFVLICFDFLNLIQGILEQLRFRLSIG